MSLTQQLFQPVRFVGGLFYDRPLSTPALLEFCRSIRFFLSSGMSLRDAMRSLGERGSGPTRKVAQNISRELAAGWTLQEALERQGRKFPTLFLALSTVGEETGNLPEVMKDIEVYYELQRQQQAQLRSQAMLPIFQFLAAMLIVSGLIYILGMMPPVEVKGKKVYFDATGLGFIGTKGAIRFLFTVFGGLAAIACIFLLLKILLRRRAIVERILLNIPILGPTLLDLALTRFSFALQLMLDSSMSILKTIRLAFRATDNPAFMAAGVPAEENLKQGNSIYSALDQVRLFPRHYLSSVAMGEESGHLPEVMRQLAEFHDERAKKGIVLINRIIGTMVWLFVAAFVIFLIYRVFTTMYLEQIEKHIPS